MTEGSDRVRSRIDAQALVRNDWVDPSQWPAGEFERAAAFYREAHAGDERTLGVRARACASLRTWTGLQAADIGSFALGLHLRGSDLDLGLGCPADARSDMIAALSSRTRFLGERQTRFHIPRLAFAWTLEGIEIDVTALSPEAFAAACRMISQIQTAMTFEERVAYTWVKHQLVLEGRYAAYASWKQAPFDRYCPASA